MSVQTVTATIQTAKEPTVRQLITGDELYQMAGIGPSELIRGEIVERMPTGYEHGDVEFTIGFFLKSYAREHKAGKVFGGETGLYTQRNPDTVRAFDVAFMSYERFQRVESRSFLDIAPELIVEVMSPDDTWSQIQAKLNEYFAIGATLVWVVDPKLSQIHSYSATDQVKIYRSSDTLVAEDVLPEFTVSVAEIFGEE